MPILKDAKHERFAMIYVRHLNKTRAAIEAGFSAKTAKQIGHTISMRPEVAARIKELQAEQWREMQMANDEILGRLAAQARSSLALMFNEDGTPRHIRDLTVEEAYAVQEITETRTPGGRDAKGKKLPDIITRKIKMRDPTQALNMLAKHKKLIGSDVDEALGNIATALADRMAAARQRRRKPQG